MRARRRKEGNEGNEEEEKKEEDVNSGVARQGHTEAHWGTCPRN